VGREYGSLLLEADGHHLMTDVWTSVVVVLGLGLVALTNYQPLDSLMALGVALHIVVTGIKLIRRSFNGLMDHALPHEEVIRLRGIIEACLPQGTQFHLLRTRQAGRRKFADFHLLVDGDQLVREAHVLVHSLEHRLRAEVPELEVSIHLEPIDERDSWESDQLQQLGEPSEPLAIPGMVYPPKDN
jgi:cation diffusion facilitator family transporter